MQDLIVLITGANSGIGKATAIELSSLGAEIVMVCRNEEKAKAAMEEIKATTHNNKISYFICDFESQLSIKTCMTEVLSKLPRIDVLINNAGAIFGDRQITIDGIEKTIALNHMGYFLSTHYLLPLLRKSDYKRIINVSSLAHKFVISIDWNQIMAEKSYGQLYQYGLSKLFNIYFTQILAKMLIKDNITVNCLHPGTVNTGFGNSSSGFFKKLVDLGRRFLTKPSDGAKTSIFLATDNSVSNVTGTYFSHSKKAKISKIAQNEAFAQKIWDLSLQWGKISTYGENNTNS